MLPVWAHLVLIFPEIHKKRMAQNDVRPGDISMRFAWPFAVLYPGCSCTGMPDAGRFHAAWKRCSKNSTVPLYPRHTGQSKHHWETRAFPLRKQQTKGRASVQREKIRPDKSTCPRLTMLFQPAKIRMESRR